MSFEAIKEPEESKRLRTGSGIASATPNDASEGPMPRSISFFGDSP